jgi:hypothetical protein
VFEVVQHGNDAGAACYIVAEVVRMHIRKDLWVNEAIDPASLRTLSRLGGPHYLDTDVLERFEMPRP